MQSESKCKVTSRRSNVFYVNVQIFEQSDPRYWEDISCPYCEKITEHRRTNIWDLVCVECGNHSVPDPLKQFCNKEIRKENEAKRLRPKLEKSFPILQEKLKTWFVNFESCNKNEFMESLGKETHMQITDFDGKTKDVSLKDFYPKLKTAQTTNTKLFYTTKCDMGQSEALKYWSMYYEAVKWLGFEPRELTKEELEKED